MMEWKSAAEIPILLEWLLLVGRDGFYEGMQNYEKWADLDLLGARDLLDLYQEIGRRLKLLSLRAESSGDPQIPAAPEKEDPPAPPEEIYVNKDYRIYLPQRNGEEVKLRPLVKTLFILFLKHPEGIGLKSIGDYREELTSIYSRVTRRSDPAFVEETVGRLVDLTDNSIHENCSRLNARLADYFDGETLDRLQVKGEYGGPRRIRLDRAWIRWESASPEPVAI